MTSCQQFGNTALLFGRRESSFVYSSVVKNFAKPPSPLMSMTSSLVQLYIEKILAKLHIVWYTPLK